ncbi:MAG: hypothetical protein ACL7BU_09425 [Candidatus Phlomobacter fragariae]
MKTCQKADGQSNTSSLVRKGFPMFTFPSLFPVHLYPPPFLVNKTGRLSDFDKQGLMLGSLLVLVIELESIVVA